MPVPTVFTEVGDCDYFSARSDKRNARVQIAGTGKHIRTAVFSHGWSTAVGSVARSAEIVPRYAELKVIFVALDPGTVMFGLTRTDNTSIINNDRYLGDNLNSICAYGSGSLLYGASGQGPLPTFTNGAVVGVALYREGSSAKVQFYINGRPWGTAVTVTDVPYFLGTSTYYEGSMSELRTEADELEYLPEGFRPWGGIGYFGLGDGHTPEATKFTTLGANVAIADGAFAKVVNHTSGSSAVSSNAVCQVPARGRHLLYVEFPWEIDGGSGVPPLVGLASDLFNVADQYLGQLAGALVSLGYYGFDGRIYHQATATNVGNGVGRPWNATQVPGILYDPVSRQLWGTVNGLPDSGTFRNPLRRLNPVLTLPAGNWYPAVTTFGAGNRVRICTNARDQRYRPYYAEAWDGPGYLSERFCTGGLKNIGDIDRSVKFAPMGPRNRNPLIGAMELDAGNGSLDVASALDFRGQYVRAYRLREERHHSEFAALIDSVEAPNESTMAIKLADVSTRFATRVDRNVIGMGRVRLAPAVARQDVALSYDVSDNMMIAFDGVRDGGVGVISYAMLPATTSDPAAHPGAFRRTVAPQRKHTVDNLRHFYKYGVCTGTNFNLDAWTGNTPNSWGKWEPGTGTVTAAAGNTAARIQAPGTAGNTATVGYYLDMTLTELGPGAAAPFTTDRPDTSAGYAFCLAVNVSTYASGDLIAVLDGYVGEHIIAPSNANTKRFFIGGTGWHFCVIDGPIENSFTGFAISTPIGAGATDITISEIAVYKLRRIETVKEVIADTSGTSYGPYWDAQNPVVDGIYDAMAVDLRDSASNSDYYYALGLHRCTGAITSPLINSQLPALSYISTQRPTIQQLLDMQCDSWLADYYTDPRGDLRLTYLTRPASVLPRDALYLGHLAFPDVSNIQVSDDLAPALSNRAMYDPSFAGLNDTDILNSVNTILRNQLQSDYYTNTLTLPGTDRNRPRAFAAKYNFASGAEPIPRYVRGSTSTSEVPNANEYQQHRLQFAYQEGKRIVRVDIGREELESLYDALRAKFYCPIGPIPGAIITFTYPRYGFSSRFKAGVLGEVSAPSAPSFNTLRDAIIPIADSTPRTVAAHASLALGTVSSPRLHYVEFELVSDGFVSVCRVGLYNPSNVLVANLGTVAYGYILNAITGATGHAGTTDSTGAIVWGAGARVGIIWDRVSKLWFTVNGIIVGGGSPEAGTGARYSNASFPLLPAVQIGSSTASPNSLRLITTADEMRYRPAYCKPWDESGPNMQILGIRMSPTSSKAQLTLWG